MRRDRILPTNRQRSFLLLEKQVRMLLELVERSPVIRGESTSALAGALVPEAEYVIVERQQLNVLLEGIDDHVFFLKEPIMKTRGEETDSHSG